MCYFFILILYNWDNDFVVCAWGHTGHFVSKSYTQFVDSASLVPFGCNVDLKDRPVDVDLGLSRLWIPWLLTDEYTCNTHCHNISPTTPSTLQILVSEVSGQAQPLVVEDKVHMCSTMQHLPSCFRIAMAETVIVPPYSEMVFPGVVQGQAQFT